MALWGPERISKVVVTARAGATGMALPPVSWETASPKGWIGIQLPHLTDEQVWAFDKLLTSIQIRWFVGFFFFPRTNSSGDVDQDLQEN